MRDTPDLVKRNEMYRWGYNEGLVTGLAWAFGSCTISLIATVLVCVGRFS